MEGRHARRLDRPARLSRRSSPARSRPGSASAAAPSRSSARRATACRSCSRSSAAARPLRAARRSLPQGRSSSSASAAADRGALARHVADTDQQAREDELWPHYEAMINRIGRERGWPPITREHFEREAGPTARSTSARPRPSRRRSPPVRALGADRFDLKYTNGTLPHEAMMRSIELYGTEVVPRVRELLAESEPEAPTLAPTRTRRPPVGRRASRPRLRASPAHAGRPGCRAASTHGRNGTTRHPAAARGTCRRGS